MKIIADLHMHSHYSRATSKNMNIENIDKYAKIKGINLIGTGDFTHPLWFKEMKSLLREEEPGIYKYKTDVKYMLTGEISLMYTQGGHGRRVHFVILVPNFDIAEQITEWLKTKGRVDYDGRPIFGFNAIDFTEEMMKISKDIMLIPAHIMTPWFGILGSKGGFNSIEECFQDQVKNIHAVETGMSADPAMLWRISSLDKFTLVSNSDSHSYYSWKLGREANVFDCKMNYKEIIDAIIKRDKRFLYTIEVDPAYGKYHWDGHRVCDVFMGPKDSRKLNKICPVCHKEMTIGVEYRIEELADRPAGFKPEGAIPFKKLLPLAELIASAYNTQPFTKKVLTDLDKLTNEFGSELNVLLEADAHKIKLIAGEKTADIVMKNRAGSLTIQPGYDGVYGKIILDRKIKSNIPQKNLKSFI